MKRIFLLLAIFFALCSAASAQLPFRSITENPASTLMARDTLPKGGVLSFVASRLPHQNKIFYASGRYWFFWADYSLGSSNFNINYRTSTDGFNWSADANVTTFPDVDAEWAVVYDLTNNKMHIAKNIAENIPIDHDGLQYRRGTPNSDGSITWDAAFQTVIATGNNVGDFSLAIDTNGFAWVGYSDESADNVSLGNAKVIKNSASDGTWSTASGFPSLVQAPTGADVFAILAPLSNGTMYAVTYQWAVDATSNGYIVDTSGNVTSDGTVTAFAVEAAAGSRANVGRIETSSRNGEVHLAYTRVGGNEIRYNKRSSGGVWGTEVAVATGDSDFVVSSPRVCFDSQSGVALLWTNASSELWYVSSANDGASWRAPVRFQSGLPLEVGYEHMMPSRQVVAGSFLPFTYLTADFMLVYGMIYPW